MIHFVVGTKAQLIKVAPVMKLLQERELAYRFIFTGQHKQSIDDLRANFGLKNPDVVLYTGKDVTSIFQMMIWMMRILHRTFRNASAVFGKYAKNDIVLVHGDTFSTLMGALMGKLSRRKVGHIESGLRSFNLLNPFPEEIVRLLTFSLSDVYFCPGPWARANLKRYDGLKINTVANTLYDCLTIAARNPLPDNDFIPVEPFALVSLHRFENIFNKPRLEQLVQYLLDISIQIKLLFILHPPTMRRLKKCELFDKLENAPNIDLRARYDYFHFIRLVRQSEFLISDGGSNQEEAFYLGKPTLLLRKATERQEGVGRNAVISNYGRDIIMDFVRNYRHYRFDGLNLDKSPSELIVEVLKSHI